MSKKSGLAAREGALRLLHAVLTDKRLLDDAYRLEITEGPLRRLAGNDRAFAKRITTTVLKHLGEIDEVLAAFLDRGMPKKSGPLRNILRIGTAELLFLDVAPHAVVDSAVSHYRTWRKYAGFKGLTNAVLRRVSLEGRDILAQIDAAKADLPPWLHDSWVEAYGRPAVDAMLAQYHRASIPLDLSLKDNGSENRVRWAEQLNAAITPTGSLRLAEHERVDLIEGYQDGAWWIQDAAAALPAKLLGDVKGMDVLDLCAAPGGKSLQLAANGASVTAVDTSEKRLALVKDNLARTDLSDNVTCVAADLLAYKPNRFWPAILLDAPCSATGTIRRHPELIHQRAARDIAHFAKVQAKMLKKAATLLEPGGLLVFCTCSLQPEEGPEQIADFLMQHPDFGIEPVKIGEFEGLDPFIKPDGSIRTRPDLWPDNGGLDGFYACRIRRDA